jgi:hypothetical protein
MVMAKIIEFYVPQGFQKKVKWVPELQRGKVIEFPLSMTRSTSEESAAVRGHQQLEHSKARAIYAVVCLPDSRR